MKVLCLILITLGLFSLIAYGNNPDEEIISSYQPLVDRLSKDGFDLRFLSELFTDPRAGLIPSAMTISLSSGEVPELYSQFLSPESVLLSKRFLKQNLKILGRIEKRFQVEKEIIVAILLVESRFGENIGKHRVIPTLASKALMDSPDNVQNNYLILKEIEPELSYEWVEDLAKRRAAWAYHELKCFLKIIRQEKINPLEVRGSHSGALGMAQFLPSSYIAYSLNKNSFETWLLSREGAILSIGNYLKSHGWRKNLPVERKKKLLWYYNHSEPYIETILQVAEKVKR